MRHFHSVMDTTHQQFRRIKRKMHRIRKHNRIYLKYIISCNSSLWIGQSHQKEMFQVRFLGKLPFLDMGWELECMMCRWLVRKEANRDHRRVGNEHRVVKEQGVAQLQRLTWMTAIISRSRCRIIITGILAKSVRENDDADAST